MESNGTFTCLRCKLEKPVQHEGGTGYGQNARGEKTCYLCIADLDRETMIQEGNSRKLPLYLTKSKNGNGYMISNWPGTLTFQVYTYKLGYHNIGRTRTDEWFNGPDGHVWHGYQIGEFNEVLHAKRTLLLLPVIRKGRC